MHWNINEYSIYSHPNVGCSSILLLKMTLIIVIKPIRFDKFCINSHMSTLTLEGNGKCYIMDKQH